MSYRSESSALRKENQRLLKNIKRRIKNINRKYGSVPATKQFEELKHKTTRGLTLGELKTQYNDLKYIDSLKTSYIKGVKNLKKLNNIIETLRTEDNTLPDKFLALYSRFVEENGLLEKYKYEVFDVINDGLLQYDDDETIRNNVINLYEKIYKQEQVAVDDEITF